MYIPVEYYRNYNKNEKRVSELIDTIMSDLIFEFEKDNVKIVVEELKKIGEDYIANKIENGELLH